MDSTPYSQFTTSRDFLYSYLHLTPSAGKEYILFLHGFPSYSYDWRHQIKHFSSKGYGIIAPDLLGYGASSKPLDVQAYKGKAMAGDIAEILKHENIDKVIGVAHDWGSFLLSRLVNFYPSLLSKLVFVDIGYSAPGFGLTRETVNFINSQVQSALGYSCFGYFLFFAEEDAATLSNKHVCYQSEECDYAY
jgi:pimeloyl-ACP methyl ester carboxylesterase